MFGALILMLPVCNRSGTWISFFDALFTATSATCVTGLVVFDTYTQFTCLGQAVILLLIQVGGLGFMSLALFFPLVLRRRIGLKERSFLMEALSTQQLGGVVRLVKHLLCGTFLVELLGALLLMTRFVPAFGLPQGAWYAVFHSVSAFCNAGFDLMGRFSPYASLAPFAGDAVVNLTICALIVIGGIGFIVWEDVLQHGLQLRRYSFHARVVLLASAVLILSGTALFYLTERRGLLAGLPLGQQLLRALFLSVSPRTAGFNTVDMGALSSSGYLLTVLFMFIGAAPGSTGGGIKVTTFVVLGCAVAAHMRGSSDTDLLDRRVDPLQVKKAFCSVTWYLSLAFTGCFLISLERDLPIHSIVFECFSAIGTVGLSTGITRMLAPASRLVLILLMFAGRIGSLTVFMTITERQERRLRNPVEKIIIG
ncbi:TrkH family potassium uptake protein [Dysosmobacter acutus]|nr:TrkH family potassium uptake protein [Dysosmobacter acutus]